MLEADLARIAVAEFQRMGYTVHQEVAPGVGYPVADIVAVLGSLITVVEVKRSCSLKLLDQCLGWRGHANRIIACVGSRRLSHAAGLLLRHEGIGLVTVGGEFWTELHRARITRRRTRFLQDALDPAQTTGEFADAGTPGGGHFSPFKRTVQRLEEFVSDAPGCTIKEAVDGIGHHYATDSSARCALMNMLRRGIIRGVRVDDGRRPFKLYPGHQEDHMSDEKKKPADGGKKTTPNPKEPKGRPGSSIPGSRDRALDTRRDKGVERR